MKIATLIGISIMMLAAQANAQTRSPYDNTSMGISAGHYQFDPGLMINITSPFFLHDRFAIRMAGGLRWPELTFERKPSPFHGDVQLGLVVFITQHERVRLYGETGVNSTLRLGNLTDRNQIRSLYGSIGADFFLLQQKRTGLAYFIETGLALNCNTSGDDERPSQFWSFVPITGLRFYFATNSQDIYGLP